MHKNTLFFEESCKNRRIVGGSALKSPLALGSWGLCSQTQALLLPSTVTTFSTPFVTRLIAVEEEQKYQQPMFCFCFFCAIAPIFHLKLDCFC